MELLDASVVLLGLGGSVAAWVLIARRFIARQPQVPFEPRPPVPWTFFEILLVFGAYLGVLVFTGSLAADAAHEAGAPGAVKAAERAIYTPHVLLMHSLGELLVVLGALVILRYHLAQAGTIWGWRRVGGATTLDSESWAFCGVLAPVYGLQALLSLWGTSEHPIVTLLKDYPSIETLAVAALAAVVAAPIVEELFFRVLLQGWLEAIWPGPQDSLNAWPIVVSSLVFALLHVGNWPDPIPLFFLALVLGYLYQRTHRIWPSMVVHVCLNSTSLLLLWTQREA